MEDVGRVPTDLAPAPPTEPTTIPSVDGWIESLMSCKQLAEADVQRLCEKVRSLIEMPASLVSSWRPRPLRFIQPCLFALLDLGLLLACQLSRDPRLT